MECDWWNQGKGSAMGSLCTDSYRGAPPLGRPIKVVGRPCGWPNFCPLFSEILNNCHTLQKHLNAWRSRPVQAQEWPHMNLDMKINQVHACTRLQFFVAAIFFQFCPMGTCLNPRFMMVYDAKGGESKHARVFEQNIQCSCKNQMKMEEIKTCNGRN